MLQFREGAVTERGRLTRSPPPQTDGERLRWQGLGLTIEMRGRVKRFADSLYDGVRWSCEMPCADVVVHDRRGIELRGRGYAEVLQMTLPPWRLPIDELRWGHFTSDASSVVWLDWRGSHPMTLVLKDGVVDPRATVQDRTISLDGATLDLTDDRSLRNERLGKTLSRVHIPLLPKRISDARERKWCSRGVLKRGGATVASGWSIHELVSFA